MCVNIYLHVWEIKKEMIEITFIFVSNFEAACETGPSSLRATILCLFLVGNSCLK